MEACFKVSTRFRSQWMGVPLLLVVMVLGCTRSTQSGPADASWEEMNSDGIAATDPEDATDSREESALRRVGALLPVKESHIEMRK
jgi:hypothetical protein